jgi:AraC-like DNA-binding protein
VSDIRAVEARQHHRAAAKSGREAGQHRQLRDECVRQLRREDPARWTYPALAAAVGCSPELIAHIIRTEERTG